MIQPAQKLQVVDPGPAAGLREKVPDSIHPFFAQPEEVARFTAPFFRQRNGSAGEFQRAAEPGTTGRN